MKIRDKRTFAVLITPQDAPDIEVDAGATFEVDDAIGGRAPSGEPGDENYDPGEGLLAQVDNYERVDEPKSRASKKEGD